MNFTVVTICGSMRFYKHMLTEAERLTRGGWIVLMPFCAIDSIEQDSDVKAMLDRMHRSKIRMSDGVVVVTDQNFYIGESTKNEIAYTEAVGLPWRYATYVD